VQYSLTISSVWSRIQHYSQPVVALVV
jgi:hypothetical protein